MELTNEETRDGLKPPGRLDYGATWTRCTHWPRPCSSLWEAGICSRNWLLYSVPWSWPCSWFTRSCRLDQALRQRVHAKFAGPLLALLMAMALLGLALLIYSNLVDLKAELPQLVERARGLIERLRTWGRDHLPTWAFDPVPDTTLAEAETTARLRTLASYSGQHRIRLPRRGRGRRVLPDLPAP